VDPLKFLDSIPRRFSLPIAAAFGMALGFYPGGGFLIPSLTIASALASFGTIVGSINRRASRLRGMQAIALALGLVAGASVAWNEAGRLPRHGSAEELGSKAGMALVRLYPVWAEGRLSSDSSPAKNGFRSYLLEVERLGMAGKGVSVEISYPGNGHGDGLRVLARSGPEIDAGSLIRARGSFSTAASGAFAKSGPAILFAQPRDLELIDKGGRVDRIRSGLRGSFRQALARIGKRSAGLMQALILGVRDSLAPGEADAFKAAGCSHILALSGEHLSVIAVLAIAGLKPLFGPIRARLGGAVLASLFMWIVGPGPSLVRAVLMVWIGAIALALDRPQDWLTALALAVLVMVPLDPSGARSLSFTLSYLAVWGLAVLAPRFSFLLGRLLPPFLRESASASLAAQAAVSPLLAFSFGYLQFAGILASMAAGPIVTLMMWWGMGTGLVCSALPSAVPLVAPVSDFLYGVLMGIMNAAAAVPTLPLPSVVARVAASAAVAGLAAMVYARPYAEYRASGRGSVPSKLRFPPGAEGPSRGGGPGHVQALRPELSGK
jgi:ComEC/Rec2-related protein